MPPLYPQLTNTLFYGDNLEILREHIADESIDLVYLDPPFNSNRNYNVLFRDESGTESEAQITAFEDTWHWGPDAEQTFDELVNGAPENVSQMIGSFRQFLGENQMMAYLVMMAPRLGELRRVMKPTATIYLHCDPSASHYLKILMDTIFSAANFRNEIIWAYRGGGTPRKDFGRRHDIILRYSKTDQYTFYPDAVRIPYQAEGLGRTDDAMWGKHKGSNKVYKPHPMGKVPEDWWPINVLNANDPERLPYPTQKPSALLKRIINASSAPGDIVLDPFSGCGTAIAAAQELGRRWLGIDITHLAIALQKYRLEDMFPGIRFNVIREPTDLASAMDLAKHDPYQFQFWATSLVRAKPLGGQEGSKQGKKGSDRGIDGAITFIEDSSSKKLKRVLIQVKSGHVSSRDIRDLRGTVEREQAPIAAFITLQQPTRDMIAEAASAGYYTWPWTGEKFPRIQILTVAELLNRSKRIEMPQSYGTFKQAQRVRQAAGEQLGFDVE